MNKEKQIEEMAKDLAISIVWKDLYDDEVTVDTKATSVKMQDNGYRLASEVVEEVFEWLEEKGFLNIEVWAIQDVKAELKKKYAEE